jgi:hypothetical protein
MPDLGRSPATDWLLAEYDDTHNPFENISDNHSAALWRGVYVQPMLKFKSVTEPGKPMRITQADYADPRRWWL